jgi:hypothetical protein
MGLPQAEEGEELAHVAEYERLKVPHQLGFRL